ncbi:MAG: 2-succinyl-5-enolpyruvyl-6-hydroxy-3-cyclohexene-1-carboxylic-acid synthase [Flavobacteriaceae bacterium]|nr:2-succinyl-5-enolpyruvyl-6-hydroxy-3-cyclohexene-1-carboxylic-acid synthase [Flavobacteriaceae bacterium]|tara:strand:- start:51944 stop:53608 length:1665 start_codon:yes stop_codon:yes gene_type:complete
MKFSNKKLSQTITQLCLAKGIRNIVISPGSRNAPLTIGFTENKNFINYSIVDERCAAFFALGIAQQLDEPVALVCSSGSALLNYYPAISESFYSDIPLVILSADRPTELINIGDGQTIQQENVFQNHILESANCIEGDAYNLFNEAIINLALNTAISKKGPVHINLPFSEPLYKTTENLTITAKSTPILVAAKKVNEDLNPFVKKWNGAKRKLILVGVLKPNSIEKKYLDILAKDESIIVLTETTSNLHDKNFFPAIDQLIASFDKNELIDFEPEILLTFGGMVISKKIKALLRDYSPKEHWHIDPKKANDTFFYLTHHFKTTVNLFFNEFLPKIETVKSNYQSNYLSVKEYRLKKHKKYISIIPYSDLKIFSAIVNIMPKNMQLQLSNSSTIRYAQFFNFDERIDVFCNRGTSGIDGSTSTAIGAAVVSKKETLCVTGDLSFLYDSNALWNNYIPSNFKIIVINNGGGGIFRILPGEKNTNNFDTFFETKHQFTALHLCEMYNLEYTMIHCESELNQNLKSFFSSSDTPKLLEIFTPSEINDQILLEYFNFLK